MKGIIKTVYQFAIDNVKAYLRSEANQKAVQGLSGEGLTAFEAMHVLAIAFMKSQEDVMVDLLK